VESVGYFRVIQLIETGGHRTTEIKRLSIWSTRLRELGSWCSTVELHPQDAWFH